MTSAGVESEPREPIERAREPLRLGWVLVLVPVGVFLVLGVPLMIRTAMVEAFEFEGPSMCPTICSSERVAVDKAAYGLFLPGASEQSLSWGMPRAGEIVVLKSPADDVNIVKRVVGVPGDRIEVRDDRVYRNGVELPLTEVPCPAFMPDGSPRRKCRREQLGSIAYTIAADRKMFDPIPMVVPKDHVYVLGDYRDRSNDSRNPAVGVIHRGRLMGRVIRIYWSPYPGRTLTVPQ